MGNRLIQWVESGLVGFQDYGLPGPDFQFFMRVVFSIKYFQLVPAIDDSSGLALFYLVITCDESIDTLFSYLNFYCIGR